jgi:hypothetical protein
MQAAQAGGIGTRRAVDRIGSGRSAMGYSCSTPGYPHGTRSTPTVRTGPALIDPIAQPTSGDPCADHTRRQR